MVDTRKLWNLEKLSDEELDIKIKTLFNQFYENSDALTKLIKDAMVTNKELKPEIIFGYFGFVVACHDCYGMLEYLTKMKQDRIKNERV